MGTIKGITSILQVIDMRKYFVKLQPSKPDRHRKIYLYANCASCFKLLIMVIFVVIVCFPMWKNVTVVH